MTEHAVYSVRLFLYLDWGLLFAIPRNRVTDALLRIDPVSTRFFCDPLSSLTVHTRSAPLHWACHEDNFLPLAILPDCEDHDYQDNDYSDFKSDSDARGITLDAVPNTH